MTETTTSLTRSQTAPVGEPGAVVRSEPAPLAQRDPASSGATTVLTGWGANLRVPCAYTQPETVSEVRARVDPAGTIARGLGRSYGDPAINAHRRVIGLTKLDRYVAFDEATGTLTCEAGVSLARIIQDFAPRGWFPMITPGTKYVTVGGCIANDIHGKAHHAQGCFSACVDQMTVLLASGEVVVASRTEHEDLFWGTFGGMGLLGIVLTATLRLRRIETTYFRQKAVKAKDLESMLQALEQYDHEYTYSVASLDVLAKGDSLGRGALSLGEHARLDELPPELAKDPLRIVGDPKIRLPVDMPEFSMNPLSIRIVNAAIQYIQSRDTPIKHYDAFFYPLDIAADWNRIYGRRGFTQYQFVVPFEDGLRHMRKILTAIFSSGQVPPLNVLKRFGKESGGILSFPREGLTFAIDFPVRADTPALCRSLDELVLDAGGRIYLGKDSFVEPAMFEKMYPAVHRFREIKAKYDPNNVFTSELGRRVGLVPD